MKLVLRLGIKVCFDCVATEHVLKFLEYFGVFRFPFEFFGHQLTQFASRFLIVSGLHKRELYLTVQRNELSSAAFLGRPADLMAFTLHGSGDTSSLENIKP